LQDIKKRQALRKKLIEIEDDLYALGVARRINRGLNLRKRFEIFKRDNFTCQYCDRDVKKYKVALVVDHIFPKKKGGKDDISNLTTSCWECNLGKHDNLLEDRIESIK
jgi:5-methylcytosine-specific restriction endonuclease McrA